MKPPNFGVKVKILNSASLFQHTVVFKYDVYLVKMNGMKITMCMPFCVVNNLLTSDLGKIV